MQKKKSAQVLENMSIVDYKVKALGCIADRKSNSNLLKTLTTPMATPQAALFKVGLSLGRPARRLGRRGEALLYVTRFFS